MIQTAKQWLKIRVGKVKLIEKHRKSDKTEPTIGAFYLCHETIRTRCLILTVAGIKLLLIRPTAAPDVNVN